MKIQDEWQQEVIPEPVTVTGSSWSVRVADIESQCCCLGSCCEWCDLSPSTALQVSEPTVSGLCHALCVDISPICWLQSLSSSSAAAGM